MDDNRTAIAIITRVFIAVVALGAMAWLGVLSLDLNRPQCGGMHER